MKRQRPFAPDDIDAIEPQADELLAQEHAEGRRCLACAGWFLIGEMQPAASRIQHDQEPCLGKAQGDRARVGLHDLLHGAAGEGASDLGADGHYL